LQTSQILGPCYTIETEGQKCHVMVDVNQLVGSNMGVQLSSEKMLWNPCI